MMNNKLILLKVVSTNGSLLPLRQRGLTPSQIATLVKEQVDAGTLETSIEGIKLTETGKQILAQYYRENKVSGSSQWILPQKYYHRESFPKTGVVLPKKKI